MTECKQLITVASGASSFFCLFAMMIMMGWLGRWTENAMFDMQVRMDNSYWAVIHEHEECALAYEE